MAEWTDQEIDAATREYEDLQRRQQQAAPGGSPGSVPPGSAMSDADVDAAISRYAKMKQDPVLQQWVTQRLDLLNFEKFRDRPQLADDYLSSVVGQLGAPGFHDALARADISTVDPNSMDEMSKMFQLHYPDGKLRFETIPQEHSSAEAGKTVLLYQTGPKEKWSRFDEPDLSFYDIADMAGALPQIVGEIAGFKGAGVVARGIGRVAPGALTTITGGAVGAGAGEAANSLLLEGRGVRTEPSGVTLRRATDAALLSFIAGSATAGAFQIGRLMTGGAGLMPGPVTISPQAQAALAAEKELSRSAKAIGQEPLIPLTAAQLTESPVLQRIAGITETLAKRVSQVTQQQLSRVNELLAARNRGPGETAELNQLMSRLGSSASTWRQRAMGAVSGRVQLNPRVAGLSTQDAINAWRETTQARVSALYDRADAISPLMFDLRGLASWRENLAFMQQQGGVPAQLTAQLGRAIQQVDTVLGAYRGGQLINTASPTGEQLRAWRVIDGLRSEAFQATLPNPAEPLRGAVDQRISGSLMETLNGIMDNPVIPSITGARGAEFTAALTTARNAARARFDDLDTFHALASAKAYEFNPSSFARGLMKDTSDELPIQVHRMLDEAGLGARWAAVQAGVRGELMHRLRPSGADGIGNPQGVIAWLDQWRDPQTKRLFMSEVEENSWRLAATDMGELNRLGWERIVASDAPATQAALEIVTRGDREGLKRLLQLPVNDPLRQSIRAGLLDHLANMTTTMKGRGATFQAEMPDAKLIKQTIDDWRKSDVARLLAPQDLDFMENVWRYVTFATGRSDVGTSIAGAELAAALIPGRGFMNATIEWAKHLAIGRALTSPAFRRLLIGFRPGASQETGQYAALLGQIGDDLLQQAVQQPAGSQGRQP